LLRGANAYREGVDRVRNNEYAVYGIMKLPLAGGTVHMTCLWNDVTQVGHGPRTWQWPITQLLNGTSG